MHVRLRLCDLLLAWVQVELLHKLHAVGFDALSCCAQHAY